MLPFGSMPIFFSRHSAHPFERPLLLPRVVFRSPKVLLRFRVRSGETLLPRGSIFATVTAPFVLKLTSLTIIHSMSGNAWSYLRHVAYGFLRLSKGE